MAQFMENGIKHIWLAEIEGFSETIPNAGTGVCGVRTGVWSSSTCICQHSYYSDTSSSLKEDLIVTESQTFSHSYQLQIMSIKEDQTTFLYPEGAPY